MKLVLTFFAPAYVASTLQTTLLGRRWARPFARFRHVVGMDVRVDNTAIYKYLALEVDYAKTTTAQRRPCFTLFVNFVLRGVISSVVQFQVVSTRR